MYRFGKTSESHNVTYRPSTYVPTSSRSELQVVTIKGHNHYLGPYGSPESYEELPGSSPLGRPGRS